MVTLSAPPLGRSRQLALSTLIVAVAAVVGVRSRPLTCSGVGSTASGVSVGEVSAGEDSTGRKRAYSGKPAGEGRNRTRLKTPIKTIEKATTQRAASCSITGLPCSLTRTGAPSLASLLRLNRL